MNNQQKKAFDALRTKMNEAGVTESEFNEFIEGNNSKRNTTKEQASEAYIKGKLRDHQEYLGCEESRRKRLITCDLYDLEQAFEDGWDEAKKQSENKSPLQLTRNYFANHKWEIIIPEPDENGFILWEARWIRSMEEGSPYYSNISVTNMMHEERFCVSGKTGEASVEWLMAYTEEDLENILKALAIYNYYKQESKK